VVICAERCPNRSAFRAKNFAPARLAESQLGLERGNGLPHSWQDLVSSGATALQFGHSTTAPRNLRTPQATTALRSKNVGQKLINPSSSASRQLTGNPK